MNQKKCKYKLFRSKEWIKHTSSFFKTWWHDLIDFFYPASCFVCATPLRNNEILCTTCTQSLPWTSLTPIVEDIKGIQINNVIVHQCIVLFWTNEPHFLQSIVQNINTTSNTSWVSFFAKQIVLKIKTLNIQVDRCFAIPNHQNQIQLFTRYHNAMDSILHLLQKACNIPKCAPFKNRGWHFLNNKPVILFKKQQEWKDASLLVIVDSLSNPNINQYIKAFNKANTKNIILISIINRF